MGDICLGIRITLKWVLKLWFENVDCIRLSQDRFNWQDPM
jgi:hypothetical protein